MMAKSIETRIADLLNASRAGNIFDLERNGVHELIEEYFTNDAAPSTWPDEDSSDDDESDEEDPFVAEEGEAEDCPVVTVFEPGECEIECNGAVNHLIDHYSDWSCNCKLIKVANVAPNETRRGCCTQFEPAEMRAYNDSIREMDGERAVKYGYILGLISSAMRQGAYTECSRRSQQKERKKSRSTFTFDGKIVCRATLLKLLGISKNKLSALQKHHKKAPGQPRVLKSGGRKNNTKSLTLTETEQVVKFLKQYAEDHGVHLPGRVPGFKRDDIQILPSAHSKSQVYDHYVRSAEQANLRVVKPSTFRTLWLNLCPFIVVARPMTDLCWRCQNLFTQLSRAANISHQEKICLSEQLTTHLSQVDAERAFYKQLVEASVEVARQHGIQQLGPNQANSKDFTMHYSFDFAQQVHYPANAAQPGPIYFLTPRKCGIFGINCEALPRQVNFLIDEAVNCSKGSVAVISYLHYFFEHYSLGEKVVHLHCDNCSGQNKNNFVLWYFAWRILNGLHTEVHLNFMPAGHTKFSPDWCFGLLKRTFRRAEVSCLEDISNIVTASTRASGINIPQLVGREDGSVIVPCFEWQGYLSAYCRPLKGVLKYFHFKFTAEEPEKIFFKSSLADEFEYREIIDPAKFRRQPPMPRVIPAPGLSRERKEYLYRSIREFVRPDQRDVVCPHPDA